MCITAEGLAYVIMDVNKSVLKIKQYNFQSVFVNMPRKCIIFHRTDANAMRYGSENAEKKELAKGNTDWKGTNFKSFLVCAKKHISDGQFERNYVNELMGLEKKRQLVTGAFPDKIQEQNSSIKVILELHYYSVKHTSRILSFI